MAKAPNKYSQLVKDIEPLLIKLIRRVVGSGAASGAGSGGGGGVPIATHGLNSSSHTGTLGDYQAPQFLKTDGGRPLTGNLSVAGGVTIDGVDISAHAANPDAHHKRATAANSEITVNADQVVGLGPHNILDRHTIVGGAPLDVIGLSAANTLARLTPTADVGTTPQAALLKSTSAGGLILATLGVKGSVDITNGGNLYVAGSIGGASGVMVTLGDRVGFGRIPDSQFMVDVNGPLRADYLIGKHAIQLEGVLLLAHYDGHEPYASNFTGELNGHMGQVATTGGGVPVRPGKFYKGLQMAGATTNYCPNPSFEVNLGGWGILNGGTWTRYTLDAAVGTACLRGDTGSASHAYYMDIARPVGDTFVISAYVKRVTPTGTAGFYVCDSSFGNIVTSPTVVEADGWRRVSATYTVKADGIVRIILQGQAGVSYFDGVQVEYDRLTPYCDGSMGAGHAWMGTAHASNSYRVQGALSYGTAGNIQAERGTIMAWVWVDAPSAGGLNGILEAGTGWGRLSFYMNNGTTPTFYAGDGSGTVSAVGPSAGGVRQWVHVACSWDIYNDQMVVYTNGVAGTPVALTNTPDLAATMYVGDNPHWAGDVHLNGVIDDLVILDRVATAQEVLSVYESDAPVFAESSVFVFRATPTGLVWADENGLWMRDFNGEAVAGFYGGEAASHSWGGKSLQKGDILFGRHGASDGGWLYFDRDGVAGKPFLTLGWSDKNILALNSTGAFLDGALNISATGGIYQGTGTFAAPTTGLKVWNASGLGRIAAYNAGVENTRLDELGITVAGHGTTYDMKHAYKFVQPGTSTVIGGLYAWGDGASRYMQLALPAMSRFNTLQVYADATSNNPSYVSIVAATSGAVEASLWLAAEKYDLGTDGYARLKANYQIELQASEVIITGQTGTDWTNLSYGSGWGSFDANRPLQYKRFGDLVFLRGLVVRTSGSGTAISGAGALPAATGGSRLFAVTSAGAHAEVSVSTAGTLGYGGGGTPGTWVSLDGIVYSTAA